MLPRSLLSFFFFNDTATTEIYPLSLHDALPISVLCDGVAQPIQDRARRHPDAGADQRPAGRKVKVEPRPTAFRITQDRKSTRLNSSHSQISYAVFCLKKKKETKQTTNDDITRLS